MEEYCRSKSMSVYKFRGTLLKNMIPTGWKGVWYAIKLALNKKDKTYLTLSFISQQEIFEVNIKCFSLSEDLTGGKLEQVQCKIDSPEVKIPFTALISDDSVVNQKVTTDTESPSESAIKCQHCGKEVKALRDGLCCVCDHGIEDDQKNKHIRDATEMVEAQRDIELGKNAESIQRISDAEEAMSSKLLFQVNDKVKLRGDPFAESEHQKYSDQKDKIQTVQETKERKDKRGFLIKTDISDKWIHQFWYEKAEEKPALKLRVGGVYTDSYRNMGMTTKIIKHDKKRDVYFDKWGCAFSENGVLLTNGLNPSDHRQNLIEEVQPEQKYTKEQLERTSKIVGEAYDNYCECDKTQGAIAYNYITMKCNSCNKSVAHLFPSIATEKEVHACEKFSKCERWCQRSRDNYLNAQHYGKLYGATLSELEKLKASKKEGNPFKVGSKANVYDGDILRTGIVIKIIDNNLLKFDFGHNYYHYKQCERVE